MRHVFLGHHARAVQEASQSFLDDYAVLIAIHYSCVTSPEDLHTIEQVKKSNFFDNVPRKVRQAISAVSSTSDLSISSFRGYSCSGQVLATGKSVRSLRAGDYVACVDVNLGYHADIICVTERHAIRISSSNVLRLASLIGPGTLALQGVREARLQLGESVAVVGLDIVGRLMAQFFKHAGCRVYAIDHTARLGCTRATCPGADEAYMCLNDATERELLVNTSNHGVDCMVIVGSIKNEDAYTRLVRMTRFAGKIVVIGYHQSFVIPPTAHEKNIQCLVVNSYGPGCHDKRYEEQAVEYPYAYVRWTEERNMQLFIQLLEEGALALDQLIGSDIDINALSSVSSIDFSLYPSAVIRYQHDAGLTEKLPPPITKNIPARRTSCIPAMQDQLRVGVVGIGAFAKTKLLPILARTKGIKLTALADATITNALNVAPLYDIEHVLINDEQLFASDLVDAVVIASPHKFHCDQIIRSLMYGKPTFVEKPMVTDQEQLKRLMEFLYAHPAIPFCVDYSRSYAPFVRKIKGELNRRKTPVVVHYRVNAGFVPKEHWMQTDVGAGRIIGDACHILDLFMFLIDANPISVSVEALHAASDSVFPTDNFSVHISFEDGSLCSLLYTALGHENMGRERMELFFDAKTIVMDDYEYLAGFGLSKLFDETAMVPDQGHEALLTHFCTMLMSQEYQAPISLDRLHQVASLTLLIDRLACEGGGSTQFDALSSLSSIRDLSR